MAYIITEGHGPSLFLQLHRNPWRNWGSVGNLLEKSRIILPEKVVKSALRQKSRKQMRFLKSYF